MGPMGLNYRGNAAVSKVRLDQSAVRASGTINTERGTQQCTEMLPEYTDKIICFQLVLRPKIIKLTETLQNTMLFKPHH